MAGFDLLPTIVDVKILFSDDLPDGPIGIHFTEKQWDKLLADIPTTRRRAQPGAKGISYVQDPFGGYMAFFTCAGQSNKDWACVPEVTRTRVGIGFGDGCRCYYSGQKPPPPPPVPEPCTLGLTLKGKLVCLGGCNGPGTCHLVRTPRGPGLLPFITCECS